MLPPNQPPTVPVDAALQAQLEQQASQAQPAEPAAAQPVDPDNHAGQAFLSKSPFTPYPEDQQKIEPKTEMLFLPGQTFKHNQSYYDELSQRKKRVVTIDDMDFADVAGWGQMSGHDDELDDALNRPDATWTQAIDSPNGKIQMGRPKIPESHAKALTGDAAVARVRSIAGLGTTLSIPLYHTGCWVSVAAPQKETIINLHYQIAMEKMRLGRRSMGLVFSNDTIYRTSPLLNVIYECIDETSLAKGLDIREVLSHHDIPILIAGFAWLCYPKGFEYTRPYHSPDPSERKPIRGLVDISKMVIADPSQLTAWQISHLSKRFNHTTSKEDLKRYAAEHTIRQQRYELIPGKLWMNLKIPTAVESINSGTRWVDSIENLVKKTLSSEAADATRNRIIGSHASATTMRQYTQWVASIEDDAYTYEEVEVIERLLSDLSELPDVRDKYMESILAFINSTSCAIVACPVMDPKEAAYGKADYPRWEYMIPINPEQVFFQLLAQKIETLETISQIMGQAA